MLAQKLRNIVISLIQLPFFAFDVNEVTCGVNAARIYCHSSSKGRLSVGLCFCAPTLKTDVVVIEMPQSRPGRRVPGIKSHGGAEADARHFRCVRRTTSSANL